MNRWWPGMRCSGREMMTTRLVREALPTVLASLVMEYFCLPTSEETVATLWMVGADVAKEMVYRFGLAGEWERCVEVMSRWYVADAIAEWCVTGAIESGYVELVEQLVGMVLPADGLVATMCGVECALARRVAKVFGRQLSPAFIRRVLRVTMYTRWLSLFEDYVVLDATDGAELRAVDAALTAGGWRWFNNVRTIDYGAGVFRHEVLATCGWPTHGTGESMVAP